jgi:hypothetical protein
MKTPGGSPFLERSASQSALNAQASTDMASAFKSRSSRFIKIEGMLGPRPGDYNPDANTGMAAEAAKRATPRGASFGGGSSRNLPWQQAHAPRNLPEDVPRGGAKGSSTPRSEELSSVPSTFASTGTRPSSAFSSKSGRFAASKMSTPGPGAYEGEPKPLSPSKRVNGCSSVFSSKAKRFGKVECEAGPGPGDFAAKPGAFASASQRPQRSASFGSRSARASPFAPKEDLTGPCDYNLPGAFSARSDTKANGSSAFASRSGRFARTAEQGAQGADPGAYESGFHTMAHQAGKSFNKQSEKGKGGFGTSMARPAVFPGVQASDKEATPGPCAYDSERNTGAFGAKKENTRPSSAFASKSKKECYVRVSDAPAGQAQYNPDQHDSMAAIANRSFNRKLKSSSFGTRAQRELHRKEEAMTPGPGAYANAGHDPLRPTVEAQANQSARRKSGGWATSTTPRAVDPSSWQRHATEL